MANRYIDWANVAGMYPGAAKDRGSDELNAFVVAAEGEVDARLAPLYSVPFVPGSSNAPQMVRDLCTDLAYWRTIMVTEQGKVLKDYIDQRFKDILDGKLVLTTSAGIIATSGLDPWSSNVHRSAFGPDDPVNWSVSSGALQDASDSRLYD